MTDRDAFRRRLLATFDEEAREHIDGLRSEMLDLAKGGDPAASAAILAASFRRAHSFKGAARAVQMRHIEVVCDAMESLLSGLVRGDLQLAPPMIDALLEAVRLLDEAPRDGGPHPAIDPRRIDGVVARLASVRTESVPRAPVASAEPEPQPQPQPSPGPATVGDVLRVSAAKLDAIRVLAEELAAERASFQQQATDLAGLQDAFRLERRRRTQIRMHLRGEQLAAWDSGESVAQELGLRLADLVRRSRHSERTFATKAEALLDESKMLLTVPCTRLFEGLRHAVHDLARSLDKPVALNCEGEAVELDRRISTDLGDPLLHLLRNAVDHGIESRSERERAGKPAQASLLLTITPIAGNRVEIRVTDDGRGIDPAAVQAAAERLGLISEAGADPFQLVFASGLSTRTEVTDVSGRGLGLAIVREKVERLGGVVAVETRGGQGTTVRMVLPTSLSTFRGVVVRVGDRLFVIPTSHVERALRVDRSRIRTVQQRHVIDVGGAPIGLVRLHDIVGDAASAANGSHVHALAIVAGGVRVALAVDEICQEREVFVKGLGAHLERVTSVLGAAVLGSGELATILEPRELVRMATRAGSVARIENEADERPTSVLVVEDSITSRVLLSSILQTAGMQVDLAVDGIDAWSRLQSGTYDLVLSDIDMPRLDGLGLTKRIRADPRLAETPVVLLTSLDSASDRERGTEVGADAYLVKQAFDPEDLLATVRRLL